MAYKIKFTELEKNKFNLIENETIRKSCMSIYMYLIKLNEKANNNFAAAGVEHLKTSDKLKISLRNFLEKYNRYHNKMSAKTLKLRIDKLKELGLIVVEIIKKTNVYSFFRYLENGNEDEVNNHVNNKGNNQETSPDIDNTIVEADEVLPKYLNLKSSYNYLYSNSKPTKATDYDLEEKCSLDFVLELADDMFKKMRIRSNYIKSRIIAKLNKYYHNIVKINAEPYILRMIDNARDEHYRNFYKYFGKKYVQEKAPLRFTDYSNKHNYDHDYLEKEFLSSYQKN